MPLISNHAVCLGGTNEQCTVNPLECNIKIKSSFISSVPHSLCILNPRITLSMRRRISYLCHLALSGCAIQWFCSAKERRCKRDGRMSGEQYAQVRTQFNCQTMPARQPRRFKWRFNGRQSASQGVMSRTRCCDDCSSRMRRVSEPRLQPPCFLARCHLCLTQIVRKHTWVQLWLAAGCTYVLRCCGGARSSVRLSNDALSPSPAPHLHARMAQDRKTNAHNVELCTIYTILI
jgi:hypothetical protein